MRCFFWTTPYYHTVFNCQALFCNYFNSFTELFFAVLFFDCLYSTILFFLSQAYMLEYRTPFLFKACRFSNWGYRITVNKYRQAIYAIILKVFYKCYCSAFYKTFFKSLTSAAKNIMQFYQTFFECCYFIMDQKKRL